MIMMIMMIMMMMWYDGIHDTLDYFTTWRFVKGQENKSLCCTNNFRAEQLKDYRERKHDTANRTPMKKIFLVERTPTLITVVVTVSISNKA